MAKKIYVGAPTKVKKTYTITNMIGELGDMESTVYCTTAEKVYVKTSSQYKYGSSSIAFQQSDSAVELTYTLRDVNGQLSLSLNNTHKYYFSIWIKQRTSLDITFDAYWPIAEPPVMSGVTNTVLNEWEQKSIVFERTSFTTGSYAFRIDCNNYPGSNALMNVDGLMLVDLTETFGSGNEPDKDWCDSNIAFTTSTTTAEWWDTALQPIARNVNKTYVSVDGVARKVSKGYVGVDGVARAFMANMITFYVDSIECAVAEGTTWDFWLNSGMSKNAINLYFNTRTNTWIYGGSSINCETIYIFDETLAEDAGEYIEAHDYSLIFQ